MRSRPGRLPRLLLTTLGLGASPIAPGTVASVATAAVIYAVSRAPDVPQPETAALACAGLCLYGVLATLAFGGQAKGPDGNGDPGWVVADEVAGQAIASLVAVFAGSLAAHILALILFRLFDIFKPPPIRQAERLGGGLGVLADDLVAGAFAAGVLLLTWQAGLLAHLA